MDALLALTGFIAVAQLVYAGVIRTTFPFNSLLSGVLASLGVFVLTAGLRLQLTNSAEFGKRSSYQAFAEYILCNLVLFLAVFNFMG